MGDPRHLVGFVLLQRLRRPAQHRIFAGGVPALVGQWHAGPHLWRRHLGGLFRRRLVEAERRTVRTTRALWFQAWFGWLLWQQRGGQRPASSCLPAFVHELGRALAI